MIWENIETKLEKSLTVTISFPDGTIWLPDRHLSLDDWLTSIADTDEELRELNIPRIRFLQNRWPIDPLLVMEWDDQFSNDKVLLAMYVGQRAYILFLDWSEYQVIAALEPKNSPSLYQAVVGKLLSNRSFVPGKPSHIKNRRPDLLPDLAGFPAYDDLRTDQEGWAPIGEDFAGTGPVGAKRERWKRFLSDVLVGWIGKWLTIPEIGFWHEDIPESIGKVTCLNGDFADSDRS
jgi:hypothetical protein